MSGRHPDERVGRAVSVQRWECIAFVHWRYRPEQLEPLVPAGLDLQLVDGSAWVAMTPFVMAGLRAPGLPPVPGWSTFPEINVRTYVSDGERDGVLFLRVLCARRLVVTAFRAGLGLPYVHARGSVSSDRTTTSYEVGDTRAHVLLGPAELPDPVVDSLTGRWNAYTRHLGRLWRVPVEHPPWMLHKAKLDRLHTDLLADVGLPAPDDLPLVHWSPGVDVRLGAPHLVTTAK